MIDDAVMILGWFKTNKSTLILLMITMGQWWLSKIESRPADSKCDDNYNGDDDADHERAEGDYDPQVDK